jgi:hypothetical protein
MLVLAAIVFLSGQAAGAAGKAECKEAIDGRTGFAVPPPVFRKDQNLLMCVQMYQHETLPPHMKCIYAKEDGSACSLLLDLPGEKQWRVLAVDCASGEPISEKKL